MRLPTSADILSTTLKEVSEGELQIRRKRPLHHLERTVTSSIAGCPLWIEAVWKRMSNLVFKKIGPSDRAVWAWQSLGKPKATSQNRGLLRFYTTSVV